MYSHICAYAHFMCVCVVVCEKDGLSIRYYVQHDAPKKR